MKPIFYKREVGHTERPCTRVGPIGSCSISVDVTELFFLLLSSVLSGIRSVCVVEIKIPRFSPVGVSRASYM